MKKLISFIAVILVVVALYFLISRIFRNYISASELSQSYLNNPTEANEEFTNNTVTVTGKVRAFYRLLGTREVLELETNSDLPVICFFFKDETIFTARQLQQQQEVTVKGLCVGTGAYSFVRGVKIEVDDIEVN